MLQIITPLAKGSSCPKPPRLGFLMGMIKRTFKTLLSSSCCFFFLTSVDSSASGELVHVLQKIQIIGTADAELVEDEEDAQTQGKH